MAENEKNKKSATNNECDTISKPLFTGNYMHDSSVTEYEKVVEATKAISNAIKRSKKKNKQ